MEKWFLILLVILILLPFYSYIISMCVTLGKIRTMNKFLRNKEEEKNATEEQEEI
jgi:hypothetical protein